MGYIHVFHITFVNWLFCNEIEKLKLSNIIYLFVQGVIQR